jgi:hypothetical protein
MACFPVWFVRQQLLARLQDAGSPSASDYRDMRRVLELPPRAVLASAVLPVIELDHPGKRLFSVESDPPGKSDAALASAAAEVGVCARVHAHMPLLC